MPTASISWANICRSATGELLVDLFGKKVTMREREDVLSRMTDDQIKNVIRWRHEGQEATIRQEQEKRSRTFPFMVLPFELREQILLLSSEDIVAVMRYDSFDIRRIRVPSTICLNKQLRLETLRAAFMHTSFELHSGNATDLFQNWLVSLDLKPLQRNITNGFDAVRHLSFSEFYWMGSENGSNDIQLAHQCHNLRTLSLGFKRGDDRSRLDRYFNAAALRSNLSMDGLLTLSKLRVLQFTGDCSAAELSDLHDLKRWFHEQFENQVKAGERSVAVLVRLPGE